MHIPLLLVCIHFIILWQQMEILNLLELLLVLQKRMGKLSPAEHRVHLPTGLRPTVKVEVIVRVKEAMPILKMIHIQRRMTEMKMYNQVQ